MNPDLSIIIPAYNEEKRIRTTLDDYARVFDGKNTEMWIVINNTTDRTPDIVSEYTARFPWIHALNIPERIGKGGAVLEGFKKAEGQIIGFVDADHSTSADEYLRLSSFVGEHDGVIASRWMKESVIDQKQTFFRRMTSRLFNLTIRLGFGLRYHDTQCGAKMFKYALAKYLTTHVRTVDWTFDVDLLYQSHKRSADIIEVPTTWRNKEGSQLRVLRIAFRTILSLFRLRFGRMK